MDKKRILWTVLLAGLWVAGCGEDDKTPAMEGPASERLSDAEPAPGGEALALTIETVGIRLYWDELAFSKDASAFDLMTGKFNTAVISTQLIDERAALSASPTQVQSNPTTYQAKARVRELLEEVDDVLAETGAADWSQYMLVFDLFRSSGDWLIRWDGVKINEYEGAGSYGLWRDDMRDESIELIIQSIAEAKTTTHNISHVVIGQGMERLLMLNPADYGNFVSFYLEVRTQIKAAFPDIQVSAGLDWDRFLTEAVVFYAQDGTDATLGWGDVREAWRDLAEPLYAESEFIALSSSPVPDIYEGKPENIPNNHYALLSELQGNRPVMWYSINWPVTSNSEKSNQRDFLRRFLELNAGTNVSLIAWQAAIDLGPSECSLVEAVKSERASTDCNAGLFSNSVAPTTLSDEFKDIQ